jgi:hypothetical protein
MAMREQLCSHAVYSSPSCASRTTLAAGRKPDSGRLVVARSMGAPVPVPLPEGRMPVWACGSRTDGLDLVLIRKILEKMYPEPYDTLRRTQSIVACS